MMNIVKIFLVAVFLGLYSLALQWLGKLMDITSLPLNNFILIFTLLVIIVPLSLWSALKMIEVIRRN